MTRPTHKQRKAASPHTTVPKMAIPTVTRAECEALANAVAKNLEVERRPDTNTSAHVVASKTIWSDRDNGKGSNSSAAKPEIEFVPAYSLIMEHTSANAGQKGHDGTERVNISQSLLSFLRALSSHMEFDEQQYRESNPDVATAIEQNDISSGREHFIKVGYFEGRSGGVPVDEVWYLSRNADVAAAMKAGEVCVRSDAISPMGSE